MLLSLACLHVFAAQHAGDDLSGDVEEVKQEGEEEDEVWDAMETVTERAKRHANDPPEVDGTATEATKKRKVAKK